MPHIGRPPGILMRCSLQVSLCTTSRSRIAKTRIWSGRRRRCSGCWTGGRAWVAGQEGMPDSSRFYRVQGAPGIVHSCTVGDRISRVFHYVPRHGPRPVQEKTNWELHRYIYSFIRTSTTFPSQLYSGGGSFPNLTPLPSSIGPSSAYNAFRGPRKILQVKPKYRHVRITRVGRVRDAVALGLSFPSASSTSPPSPHMIKLPRDRDDLSRGISDTAHSSSFFFFHLFLPPSAPIYHCLM
jgi:hypothetical protein